MTYAEILELEGKNADKIYLVRENSFVKAYEHSAFFFHTYVSPFKVSRRYIQSVNRYVHSVGFPEAAIKKWLYAYPWRKISDKLIAFDIDKTWDEVQYQNWLEMVSVSANPADRFTPHTSIIENQPVYKTSYDALCSILNFSRHIDKNFREPLSAKAKELAYAITFGVRTLYDVPDREKQIDFIQSLCKELLFVLQILKDMRQISLNTYALNSERIESVSKQLGGLRRTATA